MKSLLDKKWILPPARTQENLIEALLRARGITDHTDFFAPNWEKYLGSWRQLPDVEPACARIFTALENHEKIRIFGDYDADGVTATAVLFLGLQKLGCLVDWELPHRVENGYGLSQQVVERCAADGVKLLITVDCGITSVAEVALANRLGVEVIITDHHAVTTELPAAAALVNPQRLENGSPLVGAAVALRLVEALFTKKFNEAEADRWLRWQADLVAVATVADCAPLTEQNRALVHFGLKTLAAGRRPGMKVLCELANVDHQKCTSEDIGFRLAPRINAAGRIAHPDLALQLLLAPNARTARSYAEKLQRLNNDRQKLTRDAVGLAATALGANFEKHSLIIHKSPDFHAGIVGLVAGRLCERYGRPAIACEERDGLVVGSCRSVPSWHVADALARHSDLFVRFGGHSEAAGFTAHAKDYPKIVEKLTTDADEHLRDADLRPQLKLDATLQAPDLNLKIWREIQKFAPFGNANKEPLFYLPAAFIADSRQVGATSAHLKLKVRVGQKEFGAIFFSGGEFAKNLAVGQTVELAVNLQKHVWNGWADLELAVVDARV